MTKWELEVQKDLYRLPALVSGAESMFLHFRSDAPALNFLLAGRASEMNILGSCILGNISYSSSTLSPLFHHLPFTTGTNVHNHHLLWMMDYLAIINHLLGSLSVGKSEAQQSQGAVYKEKRCDYCGGCCCYFIARSLAPSSGGVWLGPTQIAFQKLLLRAFGPRIKLWFHLDLIKALFGSSNFILHFYYSLDLYLYTSVYFLSILCVNYQKSSGIWHTTNNNTKYDKDLDTF